jgi:hypothetical protein
MKNSERENEGKKRTRKIFNNQTLKQMKIIHDEEIPKLNIEELN